MFWVRGVYLNSCVFLCSLTADIKEDDDEFEVIDASRSWLKKYFGDISKASVGKQVLVGGTTGWWVLLDNTYKKY